MQVDFDIALLRVSIASFVCGVKSGAHSCNNAIYFICIVYKVSKKIINAVRAQPKNSTVPCARFSYS